MTFISWWTKFWLPKQSLQSVLEKLHLPFSLDFKLVRIYELKIKKLLIKI